MNAVWMSRHRRTLALTAPVALYLLVLLTVALLVRPPLLGWIGFIIVVAVSLSVLTLSMYLWPRSRVNIDRLHPHPSDTLRLLVVLDADVEPDELARALAGRADGRRVEVRVVVPASPAVAARRLAHAIPALGSRNASVEGRVGAEDPLEATGDELLTFPADEILFVGPPPAQRDVFDEDFERRARDLFGVHCSTLRGR